MDKTRQTLRAGRGYIAVLVLCAAYAVLPQGCDEMAMPLCAAPCSLADAAEIKVTQ